MVNIFNLQNDIVLSIFKKIYVVKPVKILCKFLIKPDNFSLVRHLLYTLRPLYCWYVS